MPPSSDIVAPVGPCTAHLVLIRRSSVNRKSRPSSSYRLISSLKSPIRQMTELVCSNGATSHSNISQGIETAPAVHCVLPQNGRRTLFSRSPMARLDPIFGGTTT